MKRKRLSILSLTQSNRLLHMYVITNKSILQPQNTNHSTQKHQIFKGQDKITDMGKEPVDWSLF